MSIHVFPSLVRDQVMEQHAALRTLLAETLEATTTGPPQSDSRLAELAVRLCRQFREHLAFEDEALRPVLFVLDTWGPERVRDLQCDHARQRRNLDELLAAFQMERDVEELALALKALAVDLLQDMKEEEEGCLRAPEMSSGMLLNERR